MKRFAVKVGESMLSILCLWAMVEAYHFGSMGLQKWRER